MRYILFLITLTFSSSIFSQTPTKLLQGMSIAKQKRYLATDTIPKVIYLTDKKNIKKTAWFLNEKIIDEQVMKTINPDLIESLIIKKDSIRVEGEKFDHAIYVSIKNDYQPSFLSLNQLKSKYTNLTDTPTLFQIDHKMIHADYDNYLVDEKFILKIEVDEINNTKEQLHLNLINIITRTKANLKEANTIYIRGENPNLNIR